MLTIKNLSKSFGNQLVLDNVSLTLDENGVTLIVGLNGSGKTVFLNSITGLIPLDKGEVHIDNNEISTEYFKKEIYYIPSDSYLPEYLTGKEYAEFVNSRYEKSNREIFLEVSNLLEMSDALNKTIETYSFGMKKKLQIAVALSLDVSYILADEVFGGLDIETTILVQELFNLYSKNHKLLIVSHERNVINRFSDNILLMKKGKLEQFKGSADDLSNYIYEQGQINTKLEKIKELL